ncbi:MAG: DNA polymerase II [Spirochaetaceae bacterium]|nr:DNA polymerase II [Spirochaetaceae bacterium]
MSSTVPPGEGAERALRGFIVHAYADPHGDRLFFLGRLEDGRSFAAVDSRWRPCLHIREEDRKAAAALLGTLDYRMGPGAAESFSGQRLLRLEFSRYGARAAAAKLLEQGRIPSPDGDRKPPDAFLIERRIRGPVEIRGRWRQGRRADLVFPEADLRPAGGPAAFPLRIASIAIETDTGGSIRALGIRWTEFRADGGLIRGLAPPPDAPARRGFAPGEASLLAAFVEDIRLLDPDVLTGWNFLALDFPRLEERCRRLGVPFSLGRAGERGISFPEKGTALVPGRQVIDARRILRSGPRLFSSGEAADDSLHAVSRAVLGEAVTDGPAITDSPAVTGDREGLQAGRDAALVLGLLAKTGLFRLTLERACLTGVSLDKAWTSVVSFERIYALELDRRGIAPPSPPPGNRGTAVSGAAGGTVLESRPGLFRNIAVFDFRSLYPTIIRTFNIDPLAHERVSGYEPAPPITAPNGAAFSRQPGILPALIAEYFAARRSALDAGDEEASYVYKILMNSFYGVLGTPACRYGRTELAGAITSFARKWLLRSRDWFEERGCPVLYGDTDSLFVETGLEDEAGPEDFARICGGLAEEFNRFLAQEVEAEYRRESFMELRFEKAYRRFLIPPLRGFCKTGEARGRAKGYGGWILGPGGRLTLEVKGMEAVRSDATPLARRVQVELLELVFSGEGAEALKDRVAETARLLKAGKLDGELVYRKRLSRPPETYTSSTPPQVKAARALGWKGRRGAVEYLWTLKGPEPASLPHASPDYEHYLESQVFPVARSIADAAGWDIFPRKGGTRQSGGYPQELFPTGTGRQGG